VNKLQMATTIKEYAPGQYMLLISSTVIM